MIPEVYITDLIDRKREPHCPRVRESDREGLSIGPRKFKIHDDGERHGFLIRFEARKDKNRNEIEIYWDHIQHIVYSGYVTVHFAYEPGSSKAHKQLLDLSHEEAATVVSLLDCQRRIERIMGLELD